MIVNFYASCGLDRVAHLRRDRAWLEARLVDPRSRIVLVWRSRNLLVEGDAPQPVLLTPPEVRAVLRAPLDEEAPLGVALLGVAGDIAHFALDLSPLDAPETEPWLAGRGAFVDLRSVGPMLDRFHGGLLAYARGLMHWHARHRFCGVCGSPTASTDAGHVRVCRNPGCGAQHFPRTDPAVIMLVTLGDRCVLGRQRVWPPGMHSTLAGFVEPGESLEDAVAREVMEEVGLPVRDVRYHSSQPWPFPASVMLGFHAEAAATQLVVNHDELETARWFSREELLAPESDSFRLPRKDSIARRLIEDWLAGHGSRTA